MHFGLTITAAPAAEALTVGMVTRHLRLNSGRDDDEIRNVWIPAARKFVEAQTGLTLLTTTYLATLDQFPWYTFAAPQSRPVTSAGGILDVSLSLPVSPVQAVTSIEYYDHVNTLQTLDASRYQLDASQPVARVQPVFNSFWPVAYPRLAAVRITLTAGYGADGSGVPSDLRGVMLAIIREWFDAVSPVGDASDRLKAILAFYWTGDLNPSMSAPE